MVSFLSALKVFIYSQMLGSCLGMYLIDGNLEFIGHTTVIF